MKKTILGILLIIIIIGIYYAIPVIKNFFNSYELFSNKSTPIKNDPRQIAKDWTTVNINSELRPDNGRNNEIDMSGNYQLDMPTNQMY